MRWLRCSLAVLATSAALVVVVFATGALLIGNVMASGLQAAQGQAMGWSGQNLPPQLAGLKDVPASERFTHFRGVQLNLTDKDGKPIAVTVTPGVASSVSGTSLTLTGNDGSSHTYALDAQTINHGKPVTSGEDVVVATIDGSSTATAVFSFTPGQWTNGGPWNHK